MKTIIVDKNYNPLYTKTVSVVHKPKPSHGLRESCEDMFCSGCFRTGRDVNIIRKCMEKCRKDNNEGIYECCINKCPSNSIECTKSCKHQLKYGGDTIENKMPQTTSETMCRIL